MIKDNENGMTICVDMDDTIENLCEAWVSALNKKFNKNYTINDVKSWNLGDLYTDLTKKQIASVLFESGFWETVKPKEDAIVYLKKLQEEGHNIYICTSSHYNTCSEKMTAIIERFFPFIDWEHIIIATNKQMIKCDVLVDDGPHNLRFGEYIPILFDANHNKSFKNEDYGIQRVYNWEQAYNLIKELYTIKFNYDLWLKKNLNIK